MNEKERQINEQDEKIQEMESSLEQAQESAAKLRKTLQKTKESMINNEQISSQISGIIHYYLFFLLDKVFLFVKSETCLQNLVEDYERQLRKKETEYETKLKAMTKEMNSKIEEQEQNYNQLIGKFKEITQQNKDIIFIIRKKSSD